MDSKGYSEETCVRCGWTMGQPALNCQNDNTPHCFPSQEQDRQALEQIAAEASTGIALGMPEYPNTVRSLLERIVELANG